MGYDVDHWARLYAAGATYRELARMAGVDESTVRRHLKPLLDSGSRPPGPRGRRDVGVDGALAAVTTEGSGRRAAEALGVSRTVIRHRLHAAGQGADPHPARRPTARSKETTP